MATTGTGLTQAAAVLIDAFNRADWDAFRASVTPEVAYTETGTGRHVEGAEPYIELCQGWKAAFPDVIGTIQSAITSDDVVAQEIVWEGTHTGAAVLPDGTPLPPSGRAVRLPECLMFTVRGGKVVRLAPYVDMLDTLRQLGALPTPGGGSA